MARVEELAWAAGFFDGDGNVYYSASERRTPRLIIQIDQVIREPLDRFVAAVGEGKVLGPYKQKNRQANDYYKWSLEGYSKPLSVFLQIAPYMCSSKRDQFFSAFEKYELWQKNPVCVRLHPMIQRPNSKGNYCPTCAVAAGKKASAARWKKEEESGKEIFSGVGP